MGAANVVRRAHVKEEVLCAVIADGEIRDFCSKNDFNGAQYAKNAFKLYGKCRVLFHRPGADLVWREIRWKNANVGTLYRRPSLMTVSYDQVPPELQVATLCAG